MASKKLIVSMLKGMKEMYSTYKPTDDAESIIAVWQWALDGYTDEQVAPAFKLCLQSCKFAPTSADIIDAINKLSQMASPSTEDMWQILLLAIDDTTRYLRWLRYESNPAIRARYHDGIQQTWDKLPQSIKDYVGSIGELKELGGSTDTDISFYHKRFLKEFNPVTDTRLVLPAQTNKLIEN